MGYTPTRDSTIFVVGPTPGRLRVRVFTEVASLFEIVEPRYLGIVSVNYALPKLFRYVSSVPICSLKRLTTVELMKSSITVFGILRIINRAVWPLAWDIETPPV